MNQIEKIQALYEKATPKPWISDGQGSYIFGHNNYMVAEMRGFGSGEPQEINQELIVSLHAAWPLVKRLYEALDDYLNSTRNQLDHICRGIDKRSEHLDILVDAFAAFETLEEEG